MIILRLSLGLMVILLSWVSYSANEVTVKLELEELSAQAAHEVEILTLGSNPKVIVKKQFRGAKFSFRVSPGRYQMRSRSSDERGVPGEWSAVEEIVVKPKAVRFSEVGEDKKAETSADPKTKRAQTVLEWPVGGGATKYLVNLKNTETGETQEFQVSENKKILDLKPGRYEWTVQGIAESGLASDVSSVRSFTIRGPKITTPVVGRNEKKEWAILNHQELTVLVGPTLVYQCQLGSRRLQAKDWVKATGCEVTASGALMFKTALTPGEYKVTVSASAPVWVSSEPTTYEDVIKAKAADLGPIQISSSSSN